MQGPSGGGQMGAEGRLLLAHGYGRCSHEHGLDWRPLEEVFIPRWSSASLTLVFARRLAGHTVADMTQSLVRRSSPDKTHDGFRCSPEAPG